MTADKTSVDHYQSPLAHMNLFHTDAPQREVYFMGLIDVLTQYDAKKKAAHAAKAVKHGVRELLFFKEPYWHTPSLHLCPTGCTAWLSLSAQCSLIEPVCSSFRLEQKSPQFTRSSTLNVSGSSSTRSSPSAEGCFFFFFYPGHRHRSHTGGVWQCNTGVIANQHQEALEIYC